MGVKISYPNSYFWLNSWVLANIVQLGTQSFCDRFVDFRIDPGRRLYDQIVMAARSAVANIAEGTSRHDTSSETEMRLTDVARGSVNELMGDYFNFLMRRGCAIWDWDSVNAQTVWTTNLDRPAYSENLLKDVAIHIMQQKSKFDTWIESDDPIAAANCMVLLCVKLSRMLTNMMGTQLDNFKETGGFTENMTRERLEAKHRQQPDAPNCPKCGKPMVKRVAKKGVNQGNEFWSCSEYPRCNGLRNIAPRK